jgi:hypothetical protein
MLSVAGPFHTINLDDEPATINLDDEPATIRMTLRRRRGDEGRA